MSCERIIVLKFGSSVLASENDLPAAVHEIYRWRRDGWKVVAVVSAFAGETDRLLAKAERLCSRNATDATAKLVATGEEAASALLALALDAYGVPAAALDFNQLGLLATGESHNADLQHVNAEHLLRVLHSGSVAIVPGFVAHREDGTTVLLGRGGSDLTAIFLAQRLNARCRLIKDVDGIYEQDPALHPGALPLAQLTWRQAWELGAKVVQRKAIEFAQHHGVKFEVSSPAALRQTVVSEHSSKSGAQAVNSRPLRIGLLGLGTVGYGVYRELASRPDLFEVAGIAVRRPERHHGEAPAHLLTTDPWTAAADADVVVELIGGTEPATKLIVNALRTGQHVVTANKAVIASAGDELEQLADASGAELLFSGAVGGAVPMLEAVSRISATERIVEITGVLNGTCNFVLDRIAAGSKFEAAVAEAQSAGFAEADPTFDLDGSDAAFKLILLARAAFGEALRFECIERRGIYGLDAAPAGKTWRLVGSLERIASGIRGQVQPVLLASDHPLASVREENNCLIVRTSSGTHQLHGRGAGRWPTTCAVMADLLDLARQATAFGEQEFKQEDDASFALAGGAN